MLQKFVLLIIYRYFTYSHKNKNWAYYIHQQLIQATFIAVHSMHHKKNGKYVLFMIRRFSLIDKFVEYVNDICVLQ